MLSQFYYKFTQLNKSPGNGPFHVWPKVVVAWRRRLRKEGMARCRLSAFSTCLLLPVRHSDLCDLINLQLLPVIATCAKFRLSGIEV